MVAVLYEVVSEGTLGRGVLSKEQNDEKEGVRNEYTQATRNWNYRH